MTKSTVHRAVDFAVQYTRNSHLDTRRVSSIKVPTPTAPTPTAPTPTTPTPTAPTPTGLTPAGFSSQADSSTGICFFGGEPLLLRDTIIDAVNYCSSIFEKCGHSFDYKLVTNGTLLDEDFLAFSVKNRIGIALSHDGLMQDDSRIFPNGTGTAELLETKIKLLLSYQPEAIVMCTVSPLSVEKFADSVEWLFNKGFRKIFTTPAVGEKAIWSDESLAILEEQYQKISRLYIGWTLRGERFLFPAFDTKIETHIMGDEYRHKTCRFGQKQVSVASDGRIYPCVQFVGEENYCMGDVFTGISDLQKEYVINQGRKESDVCNSCALRKRCQYNCCCRNKHLTGEIDKVSPFTCCHEQLLIRYADEAANALFEQKDRTFIKKQYECRLSPKGWESL